MAAKFHSTAMFITMTLNETRNATVAYFSGDINKQNLDQVSLNDIPSNYSRIEIAGKDAVACDRFLTNILEILIEQYEIEIAKRKRRPFWSAASICWRH